MRSFWKVATFRLTDSIRIQSGRRALRCFQNELHHFIILNLKWYPRLNKTVLQTVYTLGRLQKRTISSEWDKALFSIAPCRSYLNLDRFALAFLGKLTTLVRVQRWQKCY